MLAVRCTRNTLCGAPQKTNHLEMNIKHGMSLISIVFVLLNVLVHSAGKTLSFEVLSILPSNVGRQRLSGNAPLTVVFSLPVIRLGNLRQLFFCSSNFAHMVDSFFCYPYFLCEINQHFENHFSVRAYTNQYFVCGKLMKRQTNKLFYLKPITS